MEEFLMGVLPFRIGNPDNIYTIRQSGHIDLYRVPPRVAFCSKHTSAVAVEHVDSSNRYATGYGYHISGWIG